MMHAVVFLAAGLLCLVQQCRGQCGDVRGVTEEQKTLIVDKHNYLRGYIAMGWVEGYPPASNMQMLVWDDEMAEKAQEWADKCTWGHDTAEDRDTGRGYTGESIFEAGNWDPNPDWNAVIQNLYDEIRMYNPEEIDNYIFDKDTGHFTQLIWANTNKIGCGYTREYKGPNQYVHWYNCNYLPGGNIPGQSVYKRKY